MKKNKRGFALIEILTVTVVVLVIFTMLYANLFPLIGEYEKRVVYNDVETQYVSFYMRKLYKDVTPDLGEQGYVVLYKDKQCTLLSGDAKRKCEDIASSSELVSMIVTNKSLSGLKQKLDNNDELKELFDYIKYLPNYRKDKTEAYRLILKTKMGYATTELKVSSYSGEPNVPLLADNMIPVYYDESAKVWKKADKSNSSGQWYDYDSKKWANAVTVNGSNRSTYLSASAGTTIPMEDINTMWVWIPRYKYTYFSKKCSDLTSTPTESSHPECFRYIYKDEYYDNAFAQLSYALEAHDKTEDDINEIINNWKEGKVSIVGSFEQFQKDNHIPGVTKTLIADNMVYGIDEPQEIKIVFEKGTESNGTIKCTEEISETSLKSESCMDVTNKNLISKKSTYTHPAFMFGDNELTGFWVSKFNVSGENDIIIKPNESMKNYTLFDIFGKIRNMEIKDNIYGFKQTGSILNNSTGEINGDSNKLDTHLMKNMEWGAITYLSHSKYGWCSNGNCNRMGTNNSSKTGCGASAGTVASATCNEYFTSNGVKASTTGNVYGVYDMSGGEGNFVMASKYYYQTGSYFINVWSGNDSIPHPKYFDKYSYANSSYDYVIGKLGDATIEMSPKEYRSWYGNNASFMSAINSCFHRGGSAGLETMSGLFSFNYSTRNNGKTPTNGGHPVLTIVEK